MNRNIAILSLLSISCVSNLKGAPVTEDETVVFEAARDGDLEKVKESIAAGADKDSKDTDGMALLHYAVNNNNDEVVEYLLSVNANVNVLTKNGDTALHIAVDYKPRLFGRNFNKTRQAIIKALLNKGVDLSIKNRQGQTALDVAHSMKNARAVTLLSKASTSAQADVIAELPATTSPEKTTAIEQQAGAKQRETPRLPLVQETKYWKRHRMTTEGEVYPGAK